MDALTRDPVPDAAAIEAAARDMGIIPGDPAYAFVQCMLRVAAGVSAAAAEVPDETQQRVAPVLAQMKAATAVIEKAAARPMMTSDQIRFDVLPKLLAAFEGFWIIVGVVVALGMGAIGFGAGWWQFSAPPETCEPQAGGVVCWHWQLPPTKQAVESTPAQTKPTGGH
jgi:hypothetical protein